MKHCPLTGVPLRPAGEPKAAAHAEASSGRERRSFWASPYGKAGLAVLGAALLCGGVLLAVSLKTTGVPSAIPHGGSAVPVAGAAAELTGMVPIRTLETSGGAVWIDKYEVSVGEYKDATGGVPVQPRDFKDDHPVVNVSYADAWQYARRLGKRLCTEQEWKAAAGVRPDGKKPDFFKAVTSAAIGPGGRLPLPQDRRYTLDRSEVGAFNLLGNVKEWITASASGPPQYIGLSWNDAAVDESAALRPTARPDGAPANSIGFRCCAEVALDQGSGGLAAMAVPGPGPAGQTSPTPPAVNSVQQTGFDPKTAALPQRLEVLDQETMPLSR